MVRIVGLTITVLLVGFQLWYTNAPTYQRAWVPDSVRAGAAVGTREIVRASDAIGSAFRPPLRKTLAEVRIWLSMMDRPAAPRQGRMAAGADLSGQSFVAKRLDEATFLNATLENTDFTKAYLLRSMFDGANAAEARFDAAILENASMRAARFPRASFANADLTAVQAQGSDLSETDLTGARLDRAQLSAANLSGANLRGARMERAVLVQTDLGAADLSETIGLRQSQLDFACGDATTILPPGLTVPTCESTLAEIR